MITHDIDEILRISYVSWLLTYAYFAPKCRYLSAIEKGSSSHFFRPTGLVGPLSHFSKQKFLPLKYI